MTEEALRRVAISWDNPKCPNCGRIKLGKTGRGDIRCAKCQKLYRIYDVAYPMASTTTGKIVYKTEIVQEEVAT